MKTLGATRTAQDFGESYPRPSRHPAFPAPGWSDGFTADLRVATKFQIRSKDIDETTPWKRPTLHLSLQFAFRGGPPWGSLILWLHFVKTD